MKIYQWLQRRSGRQIILQPVLIAGMCLLPSLAHSASSYLQELEAEAARTETDQNTAPPATINPKREWASDQQSQNERIEAGLTREQFEERLKESYYGSYLFYSTLDDAEQQGVYGDYQQNNHIDSIRESIKNHMKNQ